MHGCVKCVGLGAAASAVLVCVSAAAATPVKVDNIRWEFYQGGFAQEDPLFPEVVQEFYRDTPSSTVKRVLGETSFRSEAAISNTVQHEPNGIVVTSVVHMTAEADVWNRAPQGHAGAFAGLTMLRMDFEVTGRPQLYTGEHELLGKNGAIGSGSVLEAGVYSFWYHNPFVLDVNVEARPGESASAFTTREFRFEFTTVPSPGGAAMTASLAAVVVRRRRR